MSVLSCRERRKAIKTGGATRDGEGVEKIQNRVCIWAHAWKRNKIRLKSITEKNKRKTHSEMEHIWPHYICSVNVNVSRYVWDSTDGPPDRLCRCPSQKIWAQSQGVNTFARHGIPLCRMYTAGMASTFIQWHMSVCVSSRRRCRMNYCSKCIFVVVKKIFGKSLFLLSQRLSVRINLVLLVPSKWKNWKNSSCSVH